MHQAAPSASRKRPSAHSRVQWCAAAPLQAVGPATYSGAYQQRLAECSGGYAARCTQREGLKACCGRGAQRNVPQGAALRARQLSRECEHDAKCSAVQSAAQGAAGRRRQQAWRTVLRCAGCSAAQGAAQRAQRAAGAAVRVARIAGCCNARHSAHGSRAKAAGVGHRATLRCAARTAAGRQCERRAAPGVAGRGAERTATGLAAAGVGRSTALRRCGVARVRGEACAPKRTVTEGPLQNFKLNSQT